MIEEEFTTARRKEIGRRLSISEISNLKFQIKSFFYEYLCALWW